MELCLCCCYKTEMIKWLTTYCEMNKKNTLNGTENKCTQTQNSNVIGQYKPFKCVSQTVLELLFKRRKHAHRGRKHRHC